MKQETIDKINLVEQAQEKLTEAIDLLEEAVSDNGYANAYLIDQIKVLTSGNYNFLSADFNCDKLIEQLREEDKDEEDKDEEDDEIITCAECGEECDLNTEFKCSAICKDKNCKVHEEVN